MELNTKKRRVGCPVTRALKIEKDIIDIYTDYRAMVEIEDKKTNFHKKIYYYNSLDILMMYPDSNITKEIYGNKIKHYQNVACKYIIRKLKERGWQGIKANMLKEYLLFEGKKENAMTQEKEIEYSFVVIRYIPNHKTDEFINIGIVIYDERTNNIKLLITEETERVRQFDTTGNFKTAVKQAYDILIDNEEDICNRFKSGQDEIEPTGVSENRYIYFSKIKKGKSVCVEQGFRDMYEEYVGKIDYTKNHKKEQKRICQH